MTRVAIIEDDKLLANRWADLVSAAWPSVTVEVCTSLQAAQTKLSGPPYDLVTLDIELNGVGDRSGLVLLVQLQQKKFENTAVLVVSRVAATDPTVAQLISDLKTVDLIDKNGLNDNKNSLSDAEYLHAMRMALQTKRKAFFPDHEDSSIKYGRCEIDMYEDEVFYDGVEITGVTQTQYRLLAILLRRAAGAGGFVPLTQLERALPINIRALDRGRDQKLYAIRTHLSSLKARFKACLGRELELWDYQNFAWRWKVDA